MCGCILGWRSVTYHNLVTVTLNLTSDLVSRNCCISPIFFEIGIPNLVCKCILWYLSVTNHFWVTVTLTSDLVFKNYCVQSISPILFDVGIPNLEWWFLLGWRSGAYHFESFWPWHWLLASFLVFSCYITAIFPQMCLILDQFLWGHWSRVCDISCCYYDSFRQSHIYSSKMHEKIHKNEKKNVPLIVTGNPIFILTTCMRKSTRMKSFCFYDSYRQNHIFILATFMRKFTRI